MKQTQLAIDGGQPARKDFLIFGPPLIEQDEIDAVVNVLKSGWLSTGPKAKQFEEEFKKYIEVKHALALNSCTAALHLALIGHEVGAGDEVLIPAITFAATANVVEHIGAKPVFVDIEKDSFNLDPRKAENKISQKTKAIIPVHHAGLACDMDKINELAKQHNLAVIEDAAHAVGAEYKGKKVGALGNTCCFSFYVTKNLCTGEGGMLVTNDQSLDHKLRILSLHGMDIGAWQRYGKGGKRFYDIEAPGYKYNLTDIAASMGLVQLTKLDKFIERRSQIASIFKKELGKIEGIILPPEKPYAKHAWHLFTVLLEIEKFKAGRDDIIEALIAENIGTAIHFRILPLMKFYRQKYGYKKGDFPRAEYASDRILSLPMSPNMNNDDVYDVTLACNKVLNYYRK